MIGRIYKIHSPQLEICYIGSTCNTTRDRFLQHKNQYKQWLKNNHQSPYSIYPFFQKHGIDNFKCVLVKEYEITDKKQLHVYQQLWMNKLKKTCVNKAYAFRIPIMEAKHKDWIEAQINKLYYNANKDKLKSKAKKYREANVDKVKKYYSEYKTKNADKLKEKFNCDCGGKYQKRHKSIHEKTKKHQNWIATN